MYKKSVLPSNSIVDNISMSSGIKVEIARPFHLSITNTRKKSSSCRGLLMTKSIIAALALALLGINTCLAEVQTTEEQSSAAKTETASPITQTEEVRKGLNPSDEPDLKASVQVYVMALEDLRETGMALSKVAGAASDLYEEVSRREVTLTTTPNVVGFTVMNLPSGYTTGNYLPPRKKWVDAYMADMIKVIKLFKEENDDVLNGKGHIIVPQSQKELIKGLYGQWVSVIGDTFNKVAELEKLTAQPMLNNQAIATNALTIHKDMKNLQTLIKKVYKIYQKAGQQAQETVSLTGSEVK